MRREAGGGVGGLVGPHSCAAVEAGGGGGGQSRIIIALQGIMNALLLCTLLRARFQLLQQQDDNREIQNIHTNRV